MTAGVSRPPEPDWLAARPTIDEFRSAAQRGLGRCWHWLRRFDASEYTSVLIEVSTRGIGFDLDEIDPSYIVDLAEASGSPEEVRRAAINAAQSGDSGGDLAHIDGVLFAWAKRGHADAREAIDRLFESQVAQGAGIGGFSIIELDGFDGLVRVARRAGGCISADSAWRLGAWISSCEEAGEAGAESRLRALADRDAEIAAFLGALDAERNVCGPPPAQPQGLDGLLERAVGGERGVDLWTDVRRWARASDEEQWHAVSEKFLVCEHAGEAWLLANALVVGENAPAFRPFAASIRALESRCRHRDPAISAASRRVFSKQSGPRVPALARLLLAAGEVERDTLEMLRERLAPEDVDVILEKLRAGDQRTNEETHEIVLGLLGLAERRSKRFAAPLALWGYEHSPCGRCRQRFVEWLARHGAITPEIAFEAHHDGVPAIRSLAASLA